MKPCTAQGADGSIGEFSYPHTENCLTNLHFKIRNGVGKNFKNLIK
jgi:hypothetical protein